MRQAHSKRGLLLLPFLFFSQLSFFAMEEMPLSKILKDEMRRQAGSTHCITDARGLSVCLLLPSEVYSLEGS